MMIKSCHLKTYGYSKVLNLLIEDLILLESEAGVPLQLGSTSMTIRAVLVNVLGDTLAAHDVFGLLSASANFAEIVKSHDRNFTTGS